MVAFVLPPRGQVAPADGPMSMFRRYSQGEEDEVIMMFLLLMLMLMLIITMMSKRYESKCTLDEINVDHGHKMIT